MSSSLEVVYYGKGFSKGKNGNQKPMSGISIAKGKPIEAWLKTMGVLRSMGYNVDEAFLRHTFREEWEKFKAAL